MWIEILTENNNATIEETTLVNEQRSPSNRALNSNENSIENNRSLNTEWAYNDAMFDADIRRENSLFVSPINDLIQSQSNMNDSVIDYTSWRRSVIRSASQEGYIFLLHLFNIFNIFIK